ncbi:MAG: hypothetical protein KAS23_13595, partial [Anaerohalosphaera sp.]|nr:hypothetical protein [Anaerohalosphaera sp.]
MLHELFDDHLEIDAKSLGDADSDSDLLNPLPTCKGVIFFADSNDKPIQVLTAANIRRTAKARLTCPEQTTPTKRADIASITAKVYYRYCYNNFKSSLEYYRITKALYPDSYRKLLSLPKQSFVKICLSSKWPFFAVTDNPMACKDEKVFGPFATRRSANEYALSLNNAFLLCRKPDLAASGSDLASCPYYQMEICPGPCMGRIPPEDYYGRVDKAIKAASGDARKQIEEFEVCMKQHSERMEFELADQKKK